VGIKTQVYLEQNRIHAGQSYIFGIDNLIQEAELETLKVLKEEETLLQDRTDQGVTFDHLRSRLAVKQGDASTAGAQAST